MDDEVGTNNHRPWFTRQVSSRRFSLGPFAQATRATSSPFSKKIERVIHSVISVAEQTLRECAPICAFALVIVWISYFSGVLDKDILLFTNGALILLIIISALLKRRQMRSQLGQSSVSRVQRPFPRGILIRSATEPHVTPEDRAIVSRIQNLFISKLMDELTSSRPFVPTDECAACVICLIEFDAEESVTALSCHHSFHWHCLTDWFKAQLSGASSDVTPSCPTCRQALCLSEDCLNAFAREVCEPDFLASHLSRRVHVVFHPYQQS